ncbi:MAG: nuclear transport factor 2 family protein [Pseudomonadota bacterium]
MKLSTTHMLRAASAACLALATVPALSADMPSAEAVVQSQLEAYNARNMDAFLANYADDAEIFNFPATSATKGKEEIRKRYTVRFADPTLHAVIVKRIVLGNIVIDHERVQLKFPEGDGVLELGVIYEVRDGKIIRVTATPARRGVGEKL